MEPPFFEGVSVIAMKMRCYTGPCAVIPITDACKEAGLDATKGTEHIVFDVDAKDSHEAKSIILAALKKKHGTTFGIDPRRW